MHYAARLAFEDSRRWWPIRRGACRVDVERPDQPRLLAGLRDIGTIVDVVVDGPFAYLADDRHGSGVVVVNISVPPTPRVVGAYHSEATNDVVVWNNLALLGDEAGLLHLVEVQHPTQPHLLGSLPLPGKVQRLAVTPPYVLVASDAAGLHMVEVTPDHQLQLRTTVPVPGRALDIALVEHTAYVAADAGGIQVVDVSAPRQPQPGTLSP